MGHILFCFILSLRVGCVARLKQWKLALLVIIIKQLVAIQRLAIPIIVTQLVVIQRLVVTMVIILLALVITIKELEPIKFKVLRPI